MRGTGSVRQGNKNVFMFEEEVDVVLICTCNLSGGYKTAQLSFKKTVHTTEISKDLLGDNSSVR